MGLRAEKTLKDILSGASGTARGLTYVPRDLLSAVMRVPEEDSLEAACSAMELDFAFVLSDEPDVSFLSRSLVGMGVAPFWSLSGPLGRVAMKDGWQRVLMDTIEDPQALGSTLDDAVVAACESVDEAAAARAFAVVVADDIAGRDGMMVSPDWAIDELAPRLSKIATYAADQGMVPIFHSDGDIRPMLKTIERAGFEALHTGGDGWDAFERMYGSARQARLAVVGGLEGEELRAGEVSAVAVGSRAAVLGSGTGLMVADDGGLSTVREVAALMSALGAARGHDTAGSEA